jgi:hypothetical protein
VGWRRGHGRLLCDGAGWPHQYPAARPRELPPFARGGRWAIRRNPTIGGIMYIGIGTAVLVILIIILLIILL